MLVTRYDDGTIGKPERLDNGYLRVPATITRTGVFSYLNRNGSLRRELRLPSEVFNADSVGSFEDRAVTNNHPPVALTSRNTSRYQVGHARDVRQDGDHVAATILITDGEAIEAAEDGKRQLSCGYKCDLEMKSGTTSGIEGVPDGLKYDAIQRNIRGNHIAIVTKGRAGPSAGLHLDTCDDPESAAYQVADNYEPTNPQPDLFTPRSKPMATIKIDGVEYEAPEQTIQAVQKVMARTDEATEKLDEANKTIAKEKARADAAEEKRDEAVKAREDAADPAVVDKAVKARSKLIQDSLKILGDKDAKGEAWNFDGVTDDEIRQTVVLKVSPGAKEKIDAKEGDEQSQYLVARFDQAIESYEPPKPGTKALDRFRMQSAAAGGGGSRSDADEARARMIKENHDRGRRPLGQSPQAS